MTRITGIHHITAISGNAPKTVDFFVNQLGLNMVKQTVNFDDPGTYHLYFGLGHGEPGSIMTHFPWGERAARARIGSGQVGTVSYVIGTGTASTWNQRLSGFGLSVEQGESAFGEEELRFVDPFGMPMRLVESNSSELGSQVGTFAPPELFLVNTDRTAALMEGVLGFERIAEADGIIRLKAGGAPDEPSRMVDLRVSPNERPAALGSGGVHHIAFRVADDESELAVRDELMSHGIDVTPVKDRNYFHSIYFREPGGVIFEIATDPPGFAVDEEADALGSMLMLPPWLEERREELQQKLGPL